MATCKVCWCTDCKPAHLFADIQQLLAAVRQAPPELVEQLCIPLQLTARFKALERHRLHMPQAERCAQTAAAAETEQAGHRKRCGEGGRVLLLLPTHPWPDSFHHQHWGPPRAALSPIDRQAGAAARIADAEVRASVVCVGEAEWAVLAPA